MGEVIQFPCTNRPTRAGGDRVRDTGGTITILPVVRIERQATAQLNRRAGFPGISTSETPPSTRTKKSVAKRRSHSPGWPKRTH